MKRFIPPAGAGTRPTSLIFDRGYHLTSRWSCFITINNLPLLGLGLDWLVDTATVYSHVELRFGTFVFRAGVLGC
jgi:hypothetical protein